MRSLRRLLPALLLPLAATVACGSDDDEGITSAQCDFIDKTWRERGPVGAPCETFQECSSGVCDGTKCGEFNPGGFGLILFCS